MLNYQRVFAICMLTLATLSISSQATCSRPVTGCSRTQFNGDYIQEEGRGDMGHGFSMVTNGFMRYLIPVPVLSSILSGVIVEI